MIRINLASALMKGAAEVGVKPAAPSVLANQKELKDNALKVFLILVPVIGMYFFEKQGLKSKQLALDAATLEKQQFEQKLSQFSSVDEINQQLKQQKAELDRKVSVMRKIFSLRKQKLNTILTLQESIPRSAWLQELELTGQDVKIKGSATSTDDAQSYASLLSQKRELFDKISNKGVKKVENQKTEVFEFEYEGKLRE
jgi:Tfp pilus assembly protein PilN